ncbi:MAG TPA: GtrA family protein, partial [Polyangiaceae bacterium]
FATLVDFALAGVLVHAASLHPSLATAAGCALGGLVSFTLARVWVFSSGGASAPQASRFAFVSGASAVLNAGGVALLAGLNVPFVLGWCLVRAVVFATWSYPAQRDFVFAQEDPSTEHGLVSRP